MRLRRRLLPLLLLGALAACDVPDDAALPTTDAEPDAALVEPDSAALLAPPDFAEAPVPAPGFTLPGIDGDFSLGAQRGRIVVLNFWATWNELSIEGLDALAQVQDELRGEGIIVAGLAQDEEGLDALATWTETHESAFALIADTARHVAAQYGDITLLPTTVIVDRGGLVRAHHTGILTYDELLDLLGPVLIEDDEPLSTGPAYDRVESES